jgi:hypothetical protein
VALTRRAYKKEPQRERTLYYGGVGGGKFEGGRWYVLSTEIVEDEKSVQGRYS